MIGARRTGSAQMGRDDEQAVVGHIARDQCIFDRQRAGIRKRP